VKPLCFICGKPCTLADKNTDGTYAHDACLKEKMTWHG
jgi:hypothetical protein